MVITNISEAKANLSRLIREVQGGKTVIIGKAGKPAAVLTAFKPDLAPRTLGGGWRGKVWMADDFDETPQSVIDAFHGSSGS